MDKIRFIGTTDVLSVELALEPNNRIKITSIALPTDDELKLGFEVLNEHNGSVQGDYSAYNYIYRQEIGYVIMTTSVSDVYIAPTYVTIKYTAGNGGSVSVASEEIQTNGDTITVKGCTAIPNDGYQFVNWTTLAGVEVSTDATFVPTVDATSTDIIYLANFEVIPVPEKTLDDVKAEKIAEIDSTYNTLLSGGTSATLSDSSEIYFAINQDFINDAMAAFNLASALYGTDGITVPFEINKTCYQYQPIDVIYIYIAMQLYIVALKSLRNELIGTINRKTDKDEVMAITFAEKSLDETGLAGYKASMESGENMVKVLKGKFGIVDTTETSEA